MQDLGLAKRNSYATKTSEKPNWYAFLSTRKLYTEALLEVLSEAIAEEINTTLKNECMVCFELAVQVHSCYLNNPREKVDHNFHNAFQLVGLWLANETTFEKTKDKIQVAVKDKDLYLRRSDLLRNVFFMDRLKAAVMKLVL